MLNKHMIIKDSYSDVNQILADPSLQFSIGCVVPQSFGSAKAGTPIKVDLSNISTPVTKPNGTTVPANAVLLHDVDLSHGQTNGTALLFGFVNLSRVDSTTKELIKECFTASSGTPLITFVELG